MSSKNVLDGVVRFCEGPPWTEALAARMKLHTQATCAEMHTPFETLSARLAEGAFPMMFTCVIEDLMTRQDGPEGQNLADAYLKRHGWKLGPSVRRHLLALRDSAMELFEVIGLRPDQGIELRNVLVEDHEAQVYHPGLAGALPIGCMLGARLLRQEGEITLAGGMLPFETGMDEEGLAYMRAALGVPEGSFTPAQIAEAAPHITNFWLKKTLQEAAGGGGGDTATEA